MAIAMLCRRSFCGSREVLSVIATKQTNSWAIPASGAVETSWRFDELTCIAHTRFEALRALARWVYCTWIVFRQHDFNIQRSGGT